MALPQSSGSRLLLARVGPTGTANLRPVATAGVVYNLTTETYGQTIPLAAGQRRLPGAYIWAKVNRSLDQREYLTSAGATALSDTEYLYNSMADVAVSFGYVADTDATTDLTTLYFDGVQVDLSKITYTFYDGSQTTADPTIVADKGATQTPAFKGQAYIVIRNLDLSKFSNRFPAISAVLTDTGGGTTTLEWSITKRATLLGELTASDFTFTNMTPTYPGFMVWQNSDLKTHLQNDGLLFGFDFFESGGKIKVVRKVDGSTYSSDRTLVDDDLLDLGQGQAFQIERGDEQDVPAVVNCNYVDVSVEYRMSRQRARRVQTPTPSLNSNNTADLTTSVIMTASNALSAAARAMFRMDVGRVSVSFRLPQRHLDIEPGDILVLPTIGTKIFTVKVQEATLREDLSLDVAASVLLTDEDISLTGAEGDGLIIDMSEPSPAVGTASGVGTATGVSSFVLEGETTGTASGAGSATAIGAATAEATGSASASGTALAVSGSGVSEADGAASGVGSASATGVAIASADGAASGVGSASATGASTAASVGTASGVGSASGVAYSGTAYLASLHSKDATQSLSAATWTTITYPVTEFDDGSLFDGTDSIVIPSGLNGRYMRLVGNMHCPGSGVNIQSRFDRNGAYDEPGLQWSETDSATAHTYLNHLTAPVAVATADDFTALTLFEGGATISASDPNVWIASEVMPSTFEGALVESTGSQSTGATGTVLQFDETGTGTYDLNGYFAVANNTRLTVPATGRYRLTARSKKSTGSGYFQMFFRKNGSIFPGSGYRGAITTIETAVVTVSAVVDATAGDYFEVVAQSQVADTVAAGESWFAIEKVESGGALVYLTASQAVASGVAEPIEYNTTAYDDATYWDNTNKKFVIPSGVSRVRLSAGVMFATGFSNVNLYMTKNGSEVVGLPRTMTSGHPLCVMSAIVEVSAGDELQAWILNGGATTLGSSNHTWFCLEVIA